MQNDIWAQVKDIHTIAKETFQVTFSYPQHAFTFLPGQYVWVILSNLIADDPKGDRRAFSITSSLRSTDTISIQFRNSDSAYKKTLLSLLPGETVKIIGPFGSSYVPTDDQKKIILIAGGVGVAPFLSILRSLPEFHAAIHYTLIFVNASIESRVFDDELQDITEKQSIPFINHIGSFTEELFPSTIDFAQDTFLICGPIGMIDAVYTILQKKNVPFEHMHFEQYYPSPFGNLTEHDFLPNPSARDVMLQAVNDSKNHVIVTDVNGKIIFANKKAQENTGFTFAEMKGNTPRLWGGLMSPEFYKNFWQKKHEGKGFDGEIMNRRKNGEIYYVLAHISPILDAQGTIIGYLGTEEDISKLRTLENQLLEDKKRDEALLLSMGEGVIVQDKNNKVTFINKAAQAMLGYSEEDLLGKSFIEIVHAQSLAGIELLKVERPIAKAMMTKKSVTEQIIYVRKDGTTFESEVVISPVYVGTDYYGDVQVFKNIAKEKQIDRSKTEFISLASHQLRTPLSTINWYCELLLNGDAGEITEEQKRFINEAYQGSKRMVRLVNALLNASRIEAGTYMVAPEAVNIVQMIQTIIAESKPEIDEKKLVVTFMNEDIGILPLDPDLITIILQNLLTNAIKYTLACGTITISLKQIPQNTSFEKIQVYEDMLLIQVADTGIGIPESQQNQVFQKLFRADNVRSTEGTGLGLYLVKSLVEHSRGSIWFTSAEKKGSTFFVLLPLSGMEKKDGSKKLNIQ